MEAATVATRQAPPEPEPQHDGRAEATRSTEELFRWSAYIDAGAGAKECDHKHDGKCTDPEHFHAWLCLPNTFQQRDITEKAFAAKARKRKQLLDEDSDARLVLEEELEAWQLNDETWDALCRKIADRRVRAEQMDVLRELRESEEFEHQQADLEEFRRLGALKEDERDEEEFQRLGDSIESFNKEFEARMKGRFERELDILKHTSRDEVIEIERRAAIDDMALEHFNHTYYTWAYYVCARKPRGKQQTPVERAFASPEALKFCAPEVLEAVRNAYRELESGLLTRSDAAGN